MTDTSVFEDAYRAEEDALLAKGCEAIPAQGTADWYQFIRTHDGNVNPSFKPSSSVTPDNSMALFARDKADVGVIALRAYDMPQGIRPWLATGGLWGADDPGIECKLSEYFPKVSGRVVQIGGLKVIRNDQLIGSNLDMLARIAAVQIFDADHIIALRLAGRTTGHWLDYYGSERTAPVYEGHPFYGVPIDIHLTHISRAELKVRLSDSRDSQVLDPAEVL